ncbi:putative 1-aminocyclopropane-1-carboxylate deaminase [Pseudocercospora fuligena]|uniref:Putative 1-aminocyclopropane-1-carboxylate deaminase n=1 Tax=Pseudocercospora fuligena TaxID=685502 RepID=A0A8H6RQX6_9PEZI|nr:putative 1-aminocyclopropane-1-carboxylate deaminase [Pseudocercospora fuligena]
MAETPAYLQKLKSIPKESFLFGPSPVQFLPRLTEYVSPSGDVKIWAKRDDCNSGLAYGGNKVRKLEYLVADAKSKGCTHLVSVGGVQSNHTRAVTAVATASGLKAVTIQEKWVPIDPPLYDKVGNILLSRLMGGSVRLNQEGFHIGHKTTTKDAVTQISESGGKPYYIPAGASDHELGGLGFTNFIIELSAQEKLLGGIFFDTLIVCSVTGSSHAGLIVGSVAEGRGRKVIGIDASGKPAETKDQVTRIARNTAALLDPNLVIPDEAIILDERFHEGIYGIPGPTTIEAMKIAAQTDALITDPVYEGKSMAGLIQLVKEGGIKKGSNVLYVHLGGQPALNAYSGYFEEDGEGKA